MADSKGLESVLLEQGWATSDTYCNHFKPIPDAPGVYLFECLDFDNFFKSLGIVYVGQAKRLVRRLEFSAHEVLKEIYGDDSRNWWIRRWFKEFPAEQLRTVERSYIEFYDPPFNIVGKRRGFAKAALQ